MSRTLAQGREGRKNDSDICLINVSHSNSHVNQIYKSALEARLPVTDSQMCNNISWFSRGVYFILGRCDTDRHSGHTTAIGFVYMKSPN